MGFGRGRDDMGDLSAPVTGDFARYQGYWNGFIVLATVLGTMAIGLLGTIAVLLYAIWRKL